MTKCFKAFELVLEGSKHDHCPSDGICRDCQLGFEGISFARELLDTGLFTLSLQCNSSGQSYDVVWRALGLRSQEVAAGGAMSMSTPVLRAIIALALL